MPDSTDEHGFPKPQDAFGTSNPYESPSALDDPRQGQVSRSDFPLTPWTSIWTKPRLTVRQVLDSDPSRHVLLIMILAGASNTIGNNLRTLGEAPDLSTLFGMCLYGAAIGAVVSIVILFVAGWIFTGVGRLSGGVGKSYELRTAIAYANVISVWCLPLTLCTVVFYWFVIRERVDLATAGILLALGVVLIVCGLWQFIVLCGTVAEAHQFSGGKGFLTVLLPILLIAAAIIALCYPIIWERLAT